MNMRRIFLLVLLELFLFMHSTVADTGASGKGQVCFRGECFEVEVVSSPEDRSKGLMFRESLAQSAGMLFVFEEKDVYPFWMKNTFLPLDIIWIADIGGKVVDIWENARPCSQDPCPSFTPKDDAAYVLEINAGTARRLGLAIGDTVRLL